MDDRLENIGYVCRCLLSEFPEYAAAGIPDSLKERQVVMRSLSNMRLPAPVTDDFLRAQDAELQAQLADKGVVELPASGMIEWQGDITRLKADAIVNAANSQMLGCFVPMHGCIDNAIHSAAGVQLRLACAELMQGREEPVGGAEITPGFNLPAKYVIHTVGPIISGLRASRREEFQLESCYRSCLELASRKGLSSIVFCCISTGVFRFPNARACEIAVKTVRNFLSENSATSLKTIVFNTFKDIDHELYIHELAKS